MNPSIRTILTGTACGAALLVPAGAASAHRGDRDHDGLSDRYERAHHLSVRTNSALGDPDGDGLTNRLERRLDLDPQKADTDGDGVRDGAEDNDGDGIANADESVGRVASFTGGVLTITLPDGTTVTGKVTDRTRIQCKGATTKPAAVAARHGADDPSHEDASDDEAIDDDDDGGGDDDDDDEGEDDRGHGHGHGQGVNCTTAALVAGAKVRKADLRLGNQGTEFKKVELVG